MDLDLIIMVTIIVDRLLRKFKFQRLSAIAWPEALATGHSTTIPPLKDMWLIPYSRAERFDDAGYPVTTPAGAWSPAHQKYTQVQI